MHAVTRKIKKKGYSIEGFCQLMNMPYSTFYYKLQNFGFTYSELTKLMEKTGCKLEDLKPIEKAPKGMPEDLYIP